MIARRDWPRGNGRWEMRWSRRVTNQSRLGLNGLGRIGSRNRRPDGDDRWGLGERKKGRKSQEMVRPAKRKGEEARYRVAGVGVVDLKVSDRRGWVRVQVGGSGKEGIGGGSQRLHEQEAEKGKKRREKKRAPNA